MHLSQSQLRLYSMNINTVCGFSLWLVLDTFCRLELNGWSFILGLGQRVYLTNVCPLIRPFYILQTIWAIGLSVFYFWFISFNTLFTNSHEPFYGQNFSLCLSIPIICSMICSLYLSQKCVLVRHLSFSSASQNLKIMTSLNIPLSLDTAMTAAKQITWHVMSHSNI